MLEFQRKSVSVLLLIHGLFSFSCSSKDEPDAKPVQACYGLSDRKVMKINWQATKADGSLVNGYIIGKGTLEQNTPDSMLQSLFEIEFDVFSLDSFNPLRNERLINFFFMADVHPVIEYKGVIKSISLDSLPDTGDRRSAVVDGDLVLAGQPIVTSLNIDIVNQSGIIFAKQSDDKPGFIDLSTNATVAMYLDRMLHTANVAPINPKVTLSGVMPLVSPCR
jgi:hypothetical protein